VIGISANVLKCGGIAVVEVDASHLATITSCDALNVDVPLALAAAVSARAVDLAVVLGVEVDNVDSAAAIVLYNLV
jgi:hypothetical protein